MVEAIHVARFAVQYKLGIGIPQASLYDPEKFGFRIARTRQLPELAWDMAALEQAGPSLLEGAWPALGFHWNWRPGGEAWHIAPDTGRRWAQRFFARLAYRPGNPTGDVRITWEPARLQQLVALALLAKHRPEHQNHALLLIERQIIDWSRANPFLRGVHYTSAMECALRIIALCHTLDEVRDRLSEVALWQAQIALVDGHARIIEHRLSLHSAAGNHTIAEAAGLIYAGVLFPELRGAARWRKRGLAILAHEASRQVLADGGGIEQAFWYHLFVVELLGLVTYLLQTHGIDIPYAIQNAFTRGRTFLRILARSPSTLVPVGDGDGGRALSPWLQLVWVGARVANSNTLREFPQSGYALLEPHSGSGDRVLFDCGPLGMAPGFGHGHADALAVIYMRAHSVVLIDPGTLAYGGDPEFRKYFKSTSAHNTVTIDRRDQALQHGGFLWSKPYRAGLQYRGASNDGSLAAVGYHDGYRRINVSHWRGVSFDPDGFWVICDRLEGDGAHEAVVHWHTRASVSSLGDGFILEAVGGPVWLLLAGGDTSVIRGQRAPCLGWFAPHYGNLREATTLRLAYSGHLPHVFITVISGTGRQISLDCWDTRLKCLAEAMQRATAASRATP